MSKGLKEPGDKLQLIKVLSLAQVIDTLEAKTRSQQKERGSEVDEGEESYREALGKLLNVLGLELRALIDVSIRSILRSLSIRLFYFRILQIFQTRTKSLQKRLQCSLKFFRSCFVSWQTNMMIPVLPPSLCYKVF